MPKALRITLTLTAIGIFFAVLFYGAAGESRVRCRVCVEFSDKSDCSESYGDARQSAIEGAHASACANLTSGVTNGFLCGQTPPSSIECETR
ncbi:MAG: hypothetical protein GY725_16040 [bacterium]|nr:hypothetical protein [bacterium]